MAKNRTIFVLNRVKVSGAGPCLPTQGYIEHPRGSCPVLRESSWLEMPSGMAIWCVESDGGSQVLTRSPGVDEDLQFVVLFLGAPSGFHSAHKRTSLIFLLSSLSFVRQLRFSLLRTCPRVAMAWYTVLILGPHDFLNGVAINREGGPPASGGVPPYTVRYIGMCRCIGCGFLAV